MEEGAAMVGGAGLLGRRAGISAAAPQGMEEVGGWAVRGALQRRRRLVVITGGQRSCWWRADGELGRWRRLAAGSQSGGDIWLGGSPGWRRGVDGSW